MSQWSNFPNQWVQLRPCQVHLVVEQLPHGTITMIQPRPLKNLLGEGSDLAKSPLTAACTTVCKKASTDWIFPFRRRSIFLQWKLHMEGKERIARGFEGCSTSAGRML